MRRLALPTLALALLPVALAACGGGGAKTTAGTVGTNRAGAVSPPHLTQSAFVRRGNAICQAYYAKLGRMQRAAGAKTTRRVILTMLEAAQAETAALAKLQPPPEQRARLARLVAQARQEATVVRSQLLPALQRNDQKRVAAAAARLTALETRYNATAAAMGLSVCAEPAPSQKPA